jgi:hypothetical protein
LNVSRARPQDDAASGAEPSDAHIESLLRRHPPAAPAPSEAFRSTLREHFLRSAALQADEAQEATAGRSARVAMRPEPWLGRLLAAWRGRRVAGLALTLAVAILAVAGLQRFLPEAAQPPTVLSGPSLVERNATAWIGVRDIKGWYVDAQGRRYEEWVRFEGSQPPHYRRLVDGPAMVAGVVEQWNISDGRQEWLVDGADGRIVQAVNIGGDGTVLLSTPTDLQCAFLELPAELDVAPEPIASDVLDGRPVYRLEARVGEQQRIYWLDADDFLVRRIETAGGELLWARGAIEVNSGIPRGDFAPGITRRLDL